MRRGFAISLKNLRPHVQSRAKYLATLTPDLENEVLVVRPGRSTSYIADLFHGWQRPEFSLRPPRRSLGKIANQARFWCTHGWGVAAGRFTGLKPSASFPASAISPAVRNNFISSSRLRAPELPAAAARRGRCPAISSNSAAQKPAATGQPLPQTFLPRWTSSGTHKPCADWGFLPGEKHA